MFGIIIIKDSLTISTQATYSSVIANMGFGAEPRVSGTELTYDHYSGYACGMVRIWTRALSDTEIQANYIDAKRRFNCI